MRYNSSCRPKQHKITEQREEREGKNALKRLQMIPAFCEALTTSGCAAAGKTLGSLQVGSGCREQKGVLRDAVSGGLAIPAGRCGTSRSGLLTVCGV